MREKGCWRRYMREKGCWRVHEGEGVLEEA